MNLIIIGVNHQTAPVEVREQFAIAEARLPDAVKRLASNPGIEEAMIVSTCNRVELVARATEGDANVDMQSCLQKLYGFDPQPYRKYLYEYREREAIRHVFRVASSLDSMVVGEPQILGQVKEAYATARAVGAVNSQLDALFSRAFAVAKRVRTETSIATSAVSIASVAVDLAKKRCANSRLGICWRMAPRRFTSGTAPTIAPQRWPRSSMAKPSSSTTFTTPSTALTL